MRYLLLVISFSLKSWGTCPSTNPYFSLTQTNEAWDSLQYLEEKLPAALAGLENQGPGVLEESPEGQCALDILKNTNRAVNEELKKKNCHRSYSSVIDDCKDTIQKLRVPQSLVEEAVQKLHALNKLGEGDSAFSKELISIMDGVQDDPKVAEANQTLNYCKELYQKKDVKERDLLGNVEGACPVNPASGKQLDELGSLVKNLQGQNNIHLDTEIFYGVAGAVKKNAAIAFWSETINLYGPDAFLPKQGNQDRESVKKQAIAAICEYKSGNAYMDAIKYSSYVEKCYQQHKAEIEKAFDSFYPRLQSFSQKGILKDKKRLQEEANSFNAVVDEFNKLCSQIKSDLASATEGYSHNTQANGLIGVAGVRIESEDNPREEALSKAKAKIKNSGVEDRMREMMFSHPSSRILSVPDVSKKIGLDGITQNIKKCYNRKNKKNGELKKLTTGDFSKYLPELRKNIKEDFFSAQVVLNDTRSKQQEKASKDFFKSHPYAVMGFIREHPDLEYAQELCHYVKDIYQYDKFVQTVDKVTLPVGVILSAAAIMASGGAAAPLVSATLSAYTAADLGFIVHKESQRRGQAYTRSAASGSINPEKASELLNEEKKDRRGDIASLVMEGGAGVIAKGMPTPKNVSMFDNGKPIYVESLVRQNSALSSLDRANELKKVYPKLNDQQVDAIMRAHNDVPCVVYKCTPQELAQKTRIMREGGVPEDVASDAIRRGLAGNPEQRLLSESKFLKPRPGSDRLVYNDVTINNALRDPKTDFNALAEELSFIRNHPDYHKSLLPTDKIKLRHQVSTLLKNPKVGAEIKNSLKESFQFPRNSSGGLDYSVVDPKEVYEELNSEFIIRAGEMNPNQKHVWWLKRKNEIASQGLDQNNPNLSKNIDERLSTYPGDKNSEEYLDYLKQKENLESPQPRPKVSTENNELILKSLEDMQGSSNKLFDFMRDENLEAIDEMLNSKTITDGINELEKIKAEILADIANGKANLERLNEARPAFQGDGVSYVTSEGRKRYIQERDLDRRVAMLEDRSKITLGKIDKLIADHKGTSERLSKFVDNIDVPVRSKWSLVSDLANVQADLRKLDKGTRGYQDYGSAFKSDEELKKWLIEASAKIQARIDNWGK